MNRTPTIRASALSASVLVLTTGSTFAQQITGTPGSPSATTTIDGKYLGIVGCEARKYANDPVGCFFDPTPRASPLTGLHPPP